MKPHSASSAAPRAPPSGKLARRRCRADKASASGGLASHGSGVPRCGVPTVMRPRTSGATPARCSAARAARPLAECAMTVMRWPGCSCATRCNKRTTCSAWLSVPAGPSSGTARAAGNTPGALFQTASSATVRRADARLAVLTAEGATPSLRKLNRVAVPPSTACTGAQSSAAAKGAASSNTGPVLAASHPSSWRRSSAVTTACASACTWAAASGAAGADQPLAAGGVWLAESTRPSLVRKKSSSARRPLPSGTGSTPDSAPATPWSSRATASSNGASWSALRPPSAPRSRRAGASVAMATPSASPAGGPSGSSQTRACTPRAVGARRPIA